MLRIGRQYPTFAVLLALYVLIFVYVVLRSGPQGMAFLIDTHMTVPVCAIVLSYAPLSYCRRVTGFFIAVAAVNSAIGIVEAAGKFRIFTFDSDWTVLKEQYFRASALRGHPLANATFTSVALFLALGLRWPRVIQFLLLLIFTASLVAFGSRAGLAFCVAGLAVFGIAQIRKTMAESTMTMRRAIIMVMLTILVPMCFVGFLVALLHSNIGERLMAKSYWDASAGSRMLMPQVLGFMWPEEIVFGTSTERILAISGQLNTNTGARIIENAWLLMFMRLGLVAFPFWLAATAAFIRRLICSQPLALQLAVAAYFVLATGYNSFGSKDSNYLIMVCAVVCAEKAMIPKN